MEGVGKSFSIKHKAGDSKASVQLSLGRGGNRREGHWQSRGVESMWKLAMNLFQVVKGIQLKSHLLKLCFGKKTGQFVPFAVV